MLFLVLVVFVFPVNAKPKTKVTYELNAMGFTRTKIENKTTESLACYVAIDGYKKKFRLPSFNTSQWYTANDKRINYKNFTVWCDYLSAYPSYNQYNRG